ncbi:MAG: hypothetical protein LBK76_04580 [Verrucomicrobiales bacterium]|jgi:hypothetical protein|nr:hypothetical protein [Verrucomicrobiales bacterium]
MNWPQIIKDILTSNGGAFATVVTLLGLAFYLTVAITKFITRYTAAHESLEKRLGKVESNTEDIKREIVYLNGTLDVLRPGRKTLLKSHSPIALTEDGERIAGQFDAVGIMATNWEKIRRQMDMDLPQKNAYDIQQYCLEKIAVQPELFFGAADISTMKNVAFRNGDSFFSYCQLLGILIRDRYLKEQGISVDEVDKCDPGKQAK